MLSLKRTIQRLLQIETITLSPESNFLNYNNAEPIQLRRYGAVCMLNGAVKPKATITGSGTEYVICKIPEKYLPRTKSTIKSLQQGSGNSEWLSAINNTTKSLTFSRHRDTGSNSGGYTNVTTSMWLPFTVVWIIGGGST